MSPISYKESGVDISTKEKFTQAIYADMRKTFTPRVIECPGGFSGLFSLYYNNRLFQTYKQPVLVSSTDGVGTKLKVAFMMDKHDTVGIDLVAMCVNDTLVMGAEPLFFLDYMASSKIVPGRLHEIIKGMVAGCRKAGCALIGGETPELPGFYQDEEYDLAGFVVGVVEKKRIILGKSIVPGNMVIGIRSSGLHSNGFSLVRKVFFDEAKWFVHKRVEELGCTLGEELLRPTKIYTRAIRHVLTHYKVKNVVKGIAHITGGGMPGNIPRILPEGCSIRIDKNSWPPHPIFYLVKNLGQIPEKEMYRVFNMGIGMVLIVKDYYADSIIDMLKEAGEEACVIGEVIKGNQKVELV
ncbi:MAG TPA: phosphoribosylformylglycinamidine cyclo-ligase [Candidatus Hypogeohydataceae bacterium YC40]